MTTFDKPLEQKWTTTMTEKCDVCGHELTSDHLGSTEGGVPVKKCTNCGGGIIGMLRVKIGLAEEL